MTVYSFAWVDETETTFGPEHIREDEEIYSFEKEESEGDFASLSIVIANPRVGLLADGRKQHAWFSSSDGLRFFGHLVAIPSGLSGETLTLEFDAEPSDYQAAKHAAAQALKVAPYYDALILDISKRDDPDAIIANYSASWHIDPETHEVTISDWLIGEDGTVVFTVDDVFYDGLDVTLGDAPLQSVVVEADVTWSNASSGTIDFGQHVFITYNQSVLADWPAPGTDLGGGWSVLDAYARDDNGAADAQIFNSKWSFKNDEETHRFGDTMSRNISIAQPLSTNNAYNGGVVLTTAGQSAVISENPDHHDIQPTSFKTTTLYILKSNLGTQLTLAYKAGRTRTEKLRFTLDADLQPVFKPVSTASPAAKETITISGGDVGLPILANDFLTGLPLAAEAPPIGDPSLNSYWTLPRAQDTITALASQARAKLLYSSRAVQVTFGCPYELAIQLSLRKNATVQDPRLNGGSATGKVISFSITGDGGSPGQAAKFEGRCTIGCAIGNDGEAEASAGVGSYVDAGYVDVGYQYMSGQVIPIGIGDLAYEPPTNSTIDGMQYPLTPDQVILSETIYGSIDNEEDALAEAVAIAIEAAHLGAVPNPTIEQQIQAHELAKTPVSAALQDAGIYYELQLKAVDGEGLERTYEVAMSPLFVPKLYDLAAPAA